jgi:hypothetical protein
MGMNIPGVAVAIAWLGGVGGLLVCTSLAVILDSEAWLAAACGLFIGCQLLAVAVATFEKRV